MLLLFFFACCSFQVRLDQSFAAPALEPSDFEEMMHAAGEVVIKCLIFAFSLPEEVVHGLFLK